MPQHHRVPREPWVPQDREPRVDIMFQLAFVPMRVGIAAGGASWVAGSAAPGLPVPSGLPPVLPQHQRLPSLRIAQVSLPALTESQVVWSPPIRVIPGTTSAVPSPIHLPRQNSDPSVLSAHSVSGDAASDAQ